jgi:hypothetical protein
VAAHAPCSRFVVCRTRSQLDCDDLTEARAEAARALKSANGKEDAGRLREAAVFAKAVAAWCATVPDKLRGLARMSRAEWATMLSGFWVAVKKEAHHFWARAAQLLARHAAAAC